MKLTTNIGTIIVTIMILVIAIPKTGYLMDYRLDYCNDYDKLDSYNSFETQIQTLRETEPVDINQEGFYACEIGFINAKVEIGIDVLAGSDNVGCAGNSCNFEFFIVNKDHYQNFVQGENYKETNLVSKTWTGLGSEQIYTNSNSLLYSSYYFVMNWEYRTSNQEEDIGSRNYEGAYTSIWGDESDFSFYYALDIDYTEENIEGNL